MMVTEAFVVYSMDDQRDHARMVKVCANEVNFKHFFDEKPIK